MTGKEQRILSGYHAIGNQKMLPDEDVDTKSRSRANFDLPELRHNIDMLLDQVWLNSLINGMILPQ